MLRRTLLAFALVFCLAAAAPMAGTAAGAPSGEVPSNATQDGAPAVQEAAETVDEVDADDPADAATGPPAGPSTGGGDAGGTDPADETPSTDGGARSVADDPPIGGPSDPLEEVLPTVEVAARFPAPNASDHPSVDGEDLEEFDGTSLIEQGSVSGFPALSPEVVAVTPLDDWSGATDAASGSADGASEGPARAGAYDSTGSAAESIGSSADEDDVADDPPADGTSPTDALLAALLAGLEDYSLLFGWTAVLSGVGLRRLTGCARILDAGALRRRVLPLVPLVGACRRRDDDPLENETRAAIYDLVRDAPGVYFAKVAGETGVTEETVRYHSRILEDEGLVEHRKLRGRCRLYPVELDGREAELAAAMVDSASSDVLAAIEREEPTTLSELAAALDCAPSTVAHHLDRLEEDGLVTRDRDGVSVRISLRGPTRSALRGSVADD